MDSHLRLVVGMYSQRLSTFLLSFMTRFSVHECEERISNTMELRVESE